MSGGIVFDGAQIVQGVAVLIVNCLMIGAAWANLRSGQQQNAQDMLDIKRALGMVDGEPGMFLRRSEAALMREQTKERIDEIERRVGNVEQAMLFRKDAPTPRRGK